MIVKRWFQHHGLLVLLAVLLVTACGTTISVAMRVSAAAALRTRTERLAERVQADPPETTVDRDDDGDADRGGRRGRRGEAPADPGDPAQVAAQRVQARGLFTPPPAPQFRNVIGVLGNAALYEGGQMLSIGEQRDGATLKSVGPDYVEFEYEGQTVRVDVQPGGGGGGRIDGQRGGPRGGGGRFGRPGSGGDMSDEARAALRQRMRERFGEAQNLTPEQIEELRTRFRSQRGGGDRGGDGNGGENGENRD